MRESNTGSVDSVFLTGNYKLFHLLFPHVLAADVDHLAITNQFTGLTTVSLQVRAPFLIFSFFFFFFSISSAVSCPSFATLVNLNHLQCICPVQGHHLHSVSSDIVRVKNREDSGKMQRRDGQSVLLFY